MEREDPKAIVIVRCLFFNQHDFYCCCYLRLLAMASLVLMPTLYLKHHMPDLDISGIMIDKQKKYKKKACEDNHSRLRCPYVQFLK